MRSLLLDANILVLLIVGGVDRASILLHKRTRNFVQADYDLLVATIAGYDGLVVTTSVLTEASNLLAYTNDSLRERLLAALGRFIGAVSEQRPESASVVSEQIFVRLGLTDAGLMTCVRAGHSFLTTDLDLYLAAVEISQNAINFNHLRQSSLSGR